MGSSESKPVSYSMRMPTTSSGFCGRDRNVRQYRDVINVEEINQIALGKVEVRRCGNEGGATMRFLGKKITSEEYHYIETTRKILRAARSFIPDARDDGADMQNTSFIVSIPGRDFVIKAGKGDWEYIFEEGADRQIYGRCLRQRLSRYIYNKFTNTVSRIASIVGKKLPAIGAAATALALAC